jgi:hypothetical protein
MTAEELQHVLDEVYKLAMAWHDRDPAWDANAIARVLLYAGTIYAKSTGASLEEVLEMVTQTFMK